jgi:hypothetical protein
MIDLAMILQENKLLKFDFAYVANKPVRVVIEICDL